MPAGDYDLAGFAVGAAERGRLLPRPDVAPAILSSGSVPPACIRTGFRWCGGSWRTPGWRLTRPRPSPRRSRSREALLTPTRIYVRPILQALRAGAPIKALAHITGGGFPDNLPRVLPQGLGIQLDLAAIPVPPVFRWLAAEGPVAEAEMLRTFNCGIGMAVIAAADAADGVAAALRAAGEEPVESAKSSQRRPARA